MENARIVFATPFGWMGMARGAGGIQRIYLPVEDKARAAALLEKDFGSFPERLGPFRNEIAQVEEYFSGQRKEFHFPLDFSGATEFQKGVYAILLTIPFGEVRTYAWIAREMGNAKALRAVGMANGKNKWPLVVPCHRVVGSNGFLTGFSACGGLDLKARLLRHEGVPIRGLRVQGFAGPRGQEKA